MHFLLLFSVCFTVQFYEFRQPLSATFNMQQGYLGWTLIFEKSLLIPFREIKVTFALRRYRLNAQVLKDDGSVKTFIVDLESNMAMLGDP
ncbi:hypothetical protein QUC31_008620 [Theobroma cacao]